MTTASASNELKSDLLKYNYKEVESSGNQVTYSKDGLMELCFTSINGVQQILITNRKMKCGVKVESVSAPQIFHIVEEQPEFPGGQVELMKWLSFNTKYPAIAKDAGITGVVHVQFVVREDGKVDPDDITILRGVHLALDNEAKRVIKNMPDWIPGRQRGKPVAVYYKLPFRFNLK